MSTRLVGTPIKRREDPRLLTGRGRFVDDIDLPGMLHAAVLRSPHAHARLRRIDTAAASALDGVRAVWTHADLVGVAEGRTPLLIPHPTLKHPMTQHVLAPAEVHHVGEAVAFVVAVDRYTAEDALDLIEVEWEPLPAAVDLADAAADRPVVVHDSLGTNVAAHYVGVVGDPDAAFAAAPQTLSERLSIERSASMPIETRGVVAEWDERTETLRVWDSTQAPVSIRNGLAALFDLPQTRVVVQAPDIGGGFGAKIMHFHPEEILVPLAARRLGRPVKWIEDRREHFIATNHERLQLHEAEIAFDGDGRIVAVRNRFLHDTGAYTPYGVIVPLITACQTTGPYRVPNYRVEFRSVYTNTVTVTPYRGAGRPHGCYVMERLLDRVAQHLGLDPVEVRRRNLIQPHEFPYDVGLTFQDGAPTRYDSGDYPAGLDRALALVGYGRFRSETQPAARAAGRYVGIGVTPYVEGTGIGPYEGAHIRVEPSGRVSVATGLSTQGQAHATTFAQVAADALGVPVDSILVTTGDSSAIHFGAGTFASRGAVVSGSAVALAAAQVRDRAVELASRHLEIAPADLEVRDGRIFPRGLPAAGLSFGDLARIANPLRYAYDGAAPPAPRSAPPPGPALPPGESPALEATAYYSPPGATWASGVHACVVEVDAATGAVRIGRYCVVHDCGTVINPLVVEGQIHGGVAQGIGGALYERLAYDADGQLLNASFMDFLLPTAVEIPPLELAHLATPSPLNPLGIKGVGEAGAIPVPAVLAAAIEDALSPLGVRVNRMPLSPAEIRALIVAANR